MVRVGGDVHEASLEDGFRVVEAEAVGDARAAVVAADEKSFVAVVLHGFELVDGHLAEGVVDVAVAAVGLAGVSVAAQVGDDDGVVAGELGGDLVPGDVGLGMAVEQEERGAGAFFEHADGGSGGLDVLVGEAGEEALGDGGVGGRGEIGEGAAGGGGGVGGCPVLGGLGLRFSGF